jgi:hypothetical protein
LGLGVAPPLSAQMHFIDIAAEVGLDFVHLNGASSEKRLPETTGSGAVFLIATGMVIWIFTWGTATLIST